MVDVPLVAKKRVSRQSKYQAKDAKCVLVYLAIKRQVRYFP